MEPFVLMKQHDDMKKYDDYDNVLNTSKHKMDHSEGQSWYKCMQKGCAFNGKTNAGLERHMRNHSPARLYACTKCDRRCTSLPLLNEHMKVHSESKPFWCLLCEYKCRNKANLKSHLRSHSDERPHACHLCDYKSKTFMNLKNHLRKHTGEKPFGCPACSYRCSTQGSLNVHIRVHTGEKPYVCTECPYKSTTSGGLKSHYKVHSGDKPFKCGECPASFAKLSLLRNHRNAHVRDNTFRCSTCNFQSDVSDDISKHMAEHSDPWVSLEIFGAQKNYASRESDSEGHSATSSTPEFPENPVEIRLLEGEDSNSSSGISSGDFLQHDKTHFVAAHQNPDPALYSITHSLDSAIEPSTPSEIPSLRNEQPFFSFPFSFLDKHFPPNHLHEKYWNEAGMKPKFNGHLSMFLENCCYPSAF